MGIALDTTTSIRKAILEVEETVFLAFILVILVIFIFLRSWRTTVIPMVAIPISLIGSFFVMYVSGFTINVLTLLGIVLATGLVVDDAIVVLRIFTPRLSQGWIVLRRDTKGLRRFSCRYFNHCCACCRILPIVFLDGITGRLFREFGIVVTGAVIISSFVSLTLTPMMSTRILRHKPREGWFARTMGRFFERMAVSYKASLTTFVSRRWMALLIMGASVILILGIGSQIPSELAPMEDKSRLNIMATAPEGTSYEPNGLLRKGSNCLCGFFPREGCYYSALIAILGWVQTQGLCACC